MSVSLARALHTSGIDDNGLMCTLHTSGIDGDSIMCTLHTSGIDDNSIMCTFHTSGIDGDSLMCTLHTSGIDGDTAIRIHNESSEQTADSTCFWIVLDRISISVSCHDLKRQIIGESDK